MDDPDETIRLTVLVAHAQGVLMAIQSCSAAQASSPISNAAGDNHESMATTAERIIATVERDELPSPNDDLPAGA